MSIIWQPAVTELFKDLRSVTMPVTQADVNALKGFGQIVGALNRYLNDLDLDAPANNIDYATTKLRQTHITSIRNAIYLSTVSRSYYNYVGIIPYTWTQPINKLNQLLVEELRTSLTNGKLMSSLVNNCTLLTKVDIVDAWSQFPGNYGLTPLFIGYASGSGINYTRLVMEINITDYPMDSVTCSNMKVCLTRASSSRVEDGSPGVDDIMRIYAIAGLSDQDNFSLELGSLSYNTAAGENYIEIPIDGPTFKSLPRPVYLMMVSDYERAVQAGGSEIGPSGTSAFIRPATSGLSTILLKCDDD